MPENLGADIFSWSLYFTYKQSSGKCSGSDAFTQTGKRWRLGRAHTRQPVLGTYQEAVSGEKLDWCNPRHQGHINPSVEHILSTSPHPSSAFGQVIMLRASAGIWDDISVLPCWILILYCTYIMYSTAARCLWDPYMNESQISLHIKPWTSHTLRVVFTSDSRAAACVTLTRGSGWCTGGCSATTWAGRCRTRAVETWRKVVFQWVHSHYRCHHAESQSCDIKAQTPRRGQLKLVGTTWKHTVQGQETTVTPHAQTFNIRGFMDSYKPSNFCTWITIFIIIKCF